jgi:hypothetical protein
MLALSGKRYCYYHERYFDRNTAPRDKNTYALRPFEDTRSLLFTIHQLVYSYLNDSLDEKKFTKAIYALQVAAQYANRRDALAPDDLADLVEQEKAETAPEPEKKQGGSLAQLLIDTLCDFDNKRGAFADDKPKDDPKTAPPDKDPGAK